MMNNRELALSYLRCFCAGDIDALESLLAPDLDFAGPLHRFDSRDAYIASLRRVPPGRCEYQVISLTERADEVAIFYEYEKPNGALTIGQLFGFRHNKIANMLLVFDGSQFIERV